MQDELVLITSPIHALAAKGRVDIKDLGEEPLMVMDVSEPSPWHRKIADAFLQVKAPLHRDGRKRTDRNDQENGSRRRRGGVCSADVGAGGKGK